MSKSRFDQAITVYEKLKEIGTIEGKNFKYAPGWTDRRVAQELGTALYTVESIRKSRFGKFRHDGRELLGTKYKSVKADVEALRRDVDALNASHNALVEALGYRSLRTNGAEDRRLQDIALSTAVGGRS